MSSASELVQRYASPSVVLDKRSCDTVHKLSRMLVTYLRARCHRFIVARASEPLLWQYSSDCTPLVTTERVKRMAYSLEVKRASRAAAEYLIERCFVCDAHGATTVVFDTPAEISDKGALCHLQASRSLMRYPRELGHTALNIVHHVYDRALLAPLTRLHHQVLHMLYDEFAEKGEEGDAYLGWLTTWYSIVGCSCHDIHGGVRWGIMRFIAQPALLRSAFVAIESVRNGYSVLLRHVGKWLCKVVRYDDWHGVNAAAVYRLLGVDEDWLQLMVQLQPRWCQGYLYVYSAFAERLDLPELLTTVLLKVWAFRKWSDSRWLGLTKSSKTLCLSLLCGLPDLVQFAMDQPNTSKYFIYGFVSHCSEPVKLMLAIVAASGDGAARALRLAMEDSRTPLILPQIEQELQNGVSDLFSQPACVWRVLGSLCGCSAAELRTAAVSSSLTSMGYILGKLRPARRPPYNLLVGDRRANVRRLATLEDPPADDISWKVWKLMAIGYNENLMLQGLALLSRASWTTNTTEQGHASSSCLMKMHKQYGKMMMQDRAMIIASTPLFRHTTEERQLARCREALARARRQNPNYITGRQQMLQDMHIIARKMELQGKRFRPDVTKTIMQRHAANWQGLAPAQRKRYEARASELREQRRQHLLTRQEELEAEARFREARVAELGRFEQPLTLKCARLSADEILEFDTLWDSVAFSKANIDKSLEKGARFVRRPHDAVAEALAQVEVPRPSGKKAWTPWLPLLCRQRDWLASCAIRLSEPGGVSFWKLAFAQQSPYLACFVRLRAVANVGEAEALCVREGIIAEGWQHWFEVDLAEWVWSDDGPFDLSAPFAALPGLVASGEGRFAADGEWVEMDELSSIFSEVVVGELPTEEASEAPTLASEPSVFEKHPWLLDYLHECPWLQTEGKAPSTPLGSRKLPEELETTEAEADEIFEALMTKRAEWTDRYEEETIDFSVDLLGGQWTLRHLDVVYDAFRGFAKRGAAEQWCSRYGLARSFRCGLGQVSEELAFLVCTEWCRKMQWLYNKFQAEEDGADYSDAVVRAFPEAPAVTKAWEASGRGHLRERISKIRALRPSRAP